MKKLIIGLTFAFFSLTIYSQSPIVLQDGENAFIHSNIDTIMAYANDGNSIYLPGGNLVLDHEWVINKKLYIYGAGHYADSSAATSITMVAGSNIRFGDGSSGSTLTGIYLYNDIYFGSIAADVIQFIDISRCSVRSIYLGYHVTAHNTLNSNLRLSENVIRSDIRASEAQYCLIENCIINGRIYDFKGNSSFFNNIFTYYSYSYEVFTNSSGIIANNNIFCRDNTGLSSSQIFNNIFSISINGAPGGDNVGSGNIGSQTPALTFTNFDGVAFTYDADLSLKEGSPGIGAGTDGTDIGIYGGVNPYKTSAVPVNPHIRSVNIAKETAGGTLHVEITAVAQDK